MTGGGRGGRRLPCSSHTEIIGPPQLPATQGRARQSQLSSRIGNCLPPPHHRSSATPIIYNYTHKSLYVSSQSQQQVVTCYIIYYLYILIQCLNNIYCSLYHNHICFININTNSGKPQASYILATQCHSFLL